MTLLKITQLIIKQIEEDDYTNTVVEAMHKVLAITHFETTDATYSAIMEMVTDAVQSAIDDKKKYNKYITQWDAHLQEFNKIIWDVPTEIQKELTDAMATIKRIYDMNAEVLFNQ